MQKIETEEQFNEICNSGELAIIKFGLPSCMPCKMSEKVLEEMEEKYDELKVYFCENIDLMSSLNITNIPVLYLVSDNDAERLNAYECLDELEEILTNWYNNNY